jgi:hypothetical protein
MKKITTGKWYIVIGNMCIGFGTPPEKYWEQRITRNSNQQ